jgi:phosphatidylinositol alpha-1,6-mannosyltransferase
MKRPTLDIVISEDWAPKVGGAHYWLEQVYSRWGTPVAVLTATPDSLEPVANEVKADERIGLEIYRTAAPVPTIGLSPLSWLPVLCNAIAVARRVGRSKAVIHCKAYFPEGLIGCLTKLLVRRRAKVVVYAHGEELLVAHSSRALTLIAKWVYSTADLVIANSQNTYRLLNGLGKARRVTVIHPGVDESLYRFSADERRQCRTKYGWSDSDSVVLSMARLEPRKNIFALVEALATLRARGSSVRFLCVGEGVQAAGIAELLKRDHYSEWAAHIPRVSEREKALLMCSVDLFAMPSIRHGLLIEGFGIVFLEAAAAGIPSLSGNSGGQAEAVRHGITGLNVDGTDIDALTEALHKMLFDLPLRRSMGVNGVAWAQENSWDRVADRTRESIAVLNSFDGQVN